MTLRNTNSGSLHQIRQLVSLVGSTFEFQPAGESLNARLTVSARQFHSNIFAGDNLQDVIRGLLQGGVRDTPLRGRVVRGLCRNTVNSSRWSLTFSVSPSSYDRSVTVAEVWCGSRESIATSGLGTLTTTSISASSFSSEIDRHRRRGDQQRLRSVYG